LNYKTVSHITYTTVFSVLAGT